MDEDRMMSYGGQAVIEGVMMRGRKAVAVAMRAPNGEIVVHTEPLSGIYQTRIAKIPLLRGLILLWDALGLGMRALTLSANIQSGEDEKLEGAALYATVAFSLLAGIGLFFLLPAALGGLGERFLHWSAWTSNAVEGLVRLLLLVGYIWAVGFMPDVRRVYGYHGAEHKTINAYEDGAELTPERVATYSREHARCGTAFLLTLVLMSILLFALMGPLPFWWRLSSRILLIPILAGAAYEYLKWTSAHLDSAFVRALVAPNLALQRLTTREPDLDMIEVGIASFNAMREAESALEG